MEKPFRKISELVAALANAEKGMNAGTLKLDGLETACNDARELFERLVVLRHKARESAVGGDQKSVDTLPTEMVATGPEMEPTNAANNLVEEPTPLRLDTRPMETNPRQTSLIEAIESIEEPAPPEKAPAPKRPVVEEVTAKSPVTRPKAPPSVAEKLEKAAVADLGKAISLSHKFWFVAELFNGDRINYERSIEKLNLFTSLEQAETFVKEEVLDKLKKPADPEAVTTFTDLVKRRHG
ncbi:MAG: hypothetical protein KBA60_03370 [Flavobacteriales bacterium]|nr:hypothetical protein [Flavobacteriales bacterium]MBP7155022.1 hypothetical protein [Flavobacteriales bacterium]HQV74194.1 hypothetical protein [Flavobacteriales bacterium]HQW40591.1 hypothetical protein [Flavobacteriales bacterium]